MWTCAGWTFLDGEVRACAVGGRSRLVAAAALPPRPACRHHTTAKGEIWIREIVRGSFFFIIVNLSESGGLAIVELLRGD